MSSRRCCIRRVQRRLRADVPVVSYLSGGVDSSLVVAMANKALGRPIPTFTVSVQDEGLNEESRSAATAQASRLRAGGRRLRARRAAHRLPGTDRGGRVPGHRHVVPRPAAPGRGRSTSTATRSRSPARGPTSGSPATRGSRSTSSPAGWTRFRACRSGYGCGRLFLQAHRPAVVPATRRTAHAASRWAGTTAGSTCTAS